MILVKVSNCFVQLTGHYQTAIKTNESLRSKTDTIPAAKIVKDIQA